MPLNEADTRAKWIEPRCRRELLGRLPDAGRSVLIEEKGKEIAEILAALKKRSMAGP